MGGSTAVAGLELDRDGDVVKIRLFGMLDRGTLGRTDIEARLKSIADEGARVLLDLRDVDSLSSSMGWGLLRDFLEDNAMKSGCTALLHDAATRSFLTDLFKIIKRKEKRDYRAEKFTERASAVRWLRAQTDGEFE